MSIQSIRHRAWPATRLAGRRRHRASFLAAALCTVLCAACSGPFSTLFQRDTPVAGRSAPLDIGPAVDAMAGWGDPQGVLRGFNAAAEHLSSDRITEVQRDRLLRARAEALLALVVLGDIQTDLNPMQAEALFVIVAAEVSGMQGAEPDPAAITEQVLSGLAAGGVSEVDQTFARVILDTALQAAEDESWYTASLQESMWGEHARLLALARVMRRFSSWSRRGTGSGGDVLMRDCGFLCDASDVPPTIDERAAAAGYGCPDDVEPMSSPQQAEAWAMPQPGAPAWELLVRCGPASLLLPATPGSPSLVTEANYLDAIMLTRLAGLIARIEEDAGEPGALVAAAPQWFDWVNQQLDALAVPSVITANALTLDVRLDLPRSFETDIGHAWDLLVQPPRLRMLFVRTDGVYVSVRPHLAVHDTGSAEPQLVWAEGADGWHIPGGLAVPFVGPGAIGPDELVDGRVPSLALRLGQLERSIESWNWVAPEELSAERTMSVLADGDIYFSTMEPILRTAAESGLGRLVLHTWSPALGRLSALPVRVRAEADAEMRTVLRIREDGYSMVHEEQALLTVSRVQPDALIRLYQAMLNLVGDSTVEELLISVEDGSADWGSIMNVANALSYRRDLVIDEASTADRLLLQSTPLLSEAGPVPLFLRGIVLSGPL